MSTARSLTQNKKPVFGDATREYLLVGVTGGIGSGKSIVCDQFRRLGRTVIRADEVARELTEKDAAVIGQIQSAFGDVYNAAGTLDRRALAAIVFTDRRKLERLNGIVHPAVFREIDRRLRMLPGEELRPYVVIEAALVFESGMDAVLDFVIVVDAPEELRIARVVARDGSTPEEVRSRMASQMKTEEKLKRADFTIENTGEKEGLGEIIAFLDNLLRQMGN